MASKVIIIGAGFGGLTAGAILSSKGYDVSIYEKNHEAGGRAITRKEKGYTFDLGPSWYMMPEVFDSLFEKLGKKRSNYYDIVKFSPTYKAIFKDEEFTVYPDKAKNKDLFERLEKGSYEKFEQLLKDGERLYNLAVSKYLYTSGKSFLDYLNFDFLKSFVAQKLFQTYDKKIRSLFKSEKLINILSWHTVFVGGTPVNIPALYILMLHVDFNLGTYYPLWGMHQPAKALEKILKENHAKVFYDSPVEKIIVEDGKAVGIITKGKEAKADFVISNADYYFTESKLLEPKYRQYSEKYWDKKTMSPSCFLVFLGLKHKIPSLQHHNFYFTTEPQKHFDTIYKKPQLPDDFSLYISKPSTSDPFVAPEGCENIMLLVPIAPGLSYSEEIKDQFEKKILKKFYNIVGERLDPYIEVKFTIASNDFETYYNSFKGNAFGLANTLLQTGPLRPGIESTKVKNLFFTGTTTLPGIGVPLAVISGEVTANEILSKQK